MLKRFIPIAFLLLWIVPVGWVGLMRSSFPIYPSWTAPLFRVSGVFESAPRQWRIFFIEVQDKSGEWHLVDERTLFAPTPLGNRTRFQQLINETEASQPKEAPNLLNWILNHLSQTDHSLSEVTAIRIIYFTVPSEVFLKSRSLSQVYEAANLAKTPRKIVVSRTTNTPSDENR